MGYAVNLRAVTKSLDKTNYHCIGLVYFQPEAIPHPSRRLLRRAKTALLAATTDFLKTLAVNLVME